MSTIKNPVEKKQISYKRDHDSPGKYDKAFRKQWPRKKAKVNRNVRRKIHEQELLMAMTEPTESSEMKIVSARRKKLEKWLVETLAERVARKTACRVLRVNARQLRQGKLI